MKSHEALNILKITRQTLCKYVKNGKIRVTPNINGTYNYNDDDVFKIAGVEQIRECVIYARVSTGKQKNDLLNQIETIRKYANENGYVVNTVYSDIASGLNYDRGEFQKLLKNVLNYKIKTVIIANKDRLTRVSFEMWKQLFKDFSCELVVVNQDQVLNENSEKEIFEDIISLLHCFAMKMYSARRKKKIAIIKEDLKNEIGL